MQTRPGSSRRVPFSAPRVSQTRSCMAVPESPIFTLKTDQAPSGAPHFHARPRARSGALANFSLCLGTYLPKFGVSTPPPRVTPSRESPSCKSHVRHYSRKWVRRGYLAAVTGSVWLLCVMCSCYGVYVLLSFAKPTCVAHTRRFTVKVWPGGGGGVLTPNFGMYVPRQCAGSNSSVKIRGSGASSSVKTRVSGTDCRTRLAGTLAGRYPERRGKVKNGGLRSELGGGGGGGSAE